MAEDGRHGHGAAAPWRAKVEVEGVVLDVLVSRVVLEELGVRATAMWHNEGQRTNSLLITARQVICHGL